MPKAFDNKEMLLEEDSNNALPLFNNKSMILTSLFFVIHYIKLNGFYVKILTVI